MLQTVIHHVDPQALLLVLACTAPRPEREDRPFSPYVAKALLFIAVGNGLGDYFYRHIPLLSLEYLFDLGVLLMGLGLIAGRRINTWLGYTLITIGGAATIVSFALPLWPL